MNSFARTIREQFPRYRIQKIALNSGTPIGIVARTAVYRLKFRATLERFLKGKAPCILSRYITNMQVNEPRYQASQYVTPHYCAATFRFFPDGRADHTYESIERVPGTLIPGTQKLSLLVPPGVEAELALLAAVPWKLFGYEGLNEWYEVAPTDGLSSVERNKR